MIKGTILEILKEKIQFNSIDIILSIQLNFFIKAFKLSEWNIYNLTSILVINKLSARPNKIYWEKIDFKLIIFISNFWCNTPTKNVSLKLRETVNNTKI